MERHFHEELKELKQTLMKMGLLVEASIDNAIDSFLCRKASLAEEVIETENTINQLELEIDDKGHRICALWQPMAADLRLITSILKMNTDLERMGDHAVNIAERTLSIIHQAPFTDIKFSTMPIAVLQMLSDALNSFMNEDIQLARFVLTRDDEVDQCNDEINERVTQMMERNPSTVKTGIDFLIVAHNLERIADLANNIAEDVIYMKIGKEVRHGAEQKEAKPTN